MSAAVNVAIVGATGAVGQTFLRILDERNFPVGELRLLASPRSAGKTLPFRGEQIPDTYPYSTARVIKTDSHEGIMQKMAGKRQNLI